MAWFDPLMPTAFQCIGRKTGGLPVFPWGEIHGLSPEQSWQPIDPKKAMQEQVFLGINMGETEEITVECSPAGSLQLIDRFGGYDFLFVSFSPKKGPVGGIPSQDQFFCPNLFRNCHLTKSFPQSAKLRTAGMPQKCRKYAKKSEK